MKKDFKSDLQLIPLFSRIGKASLIKSRPWRLDRCFVLHLAATSFSLFSRGKRRLGVRFDVYEIPIVRQASKAWTGGCLQSSVPRFRLV